MTTAEKLALDKYPQDIHRNLLDSRYPNDINSRPRQAFIEGYEAAEKSRELTWQDVQLIDTFILEVSREERNEGKDFGGSEGFYGEVLKRYNRIMKPIIENEER